MIAGQPSKLPSRRLCRRRSRPAREAHQRPAARHAGTGRRRRPMHVSPCRFIGRPAGPAPLRLSSLGQKDLNRHSASWHRHDRSPDREQGGPRPALPIGRVPLHQPDIFPAAFDPLSGGGGGRISWCCSSTRGRHLCQADDGHCPSLQQDVAFSTQKPNGCLKTRPLVASAIRCN